MRDLALRAKKDELMVPLAARLFGSVHPNVVSVIAMVVGLASAAVVVNEQYMLGLLLWVVNRILDGLDGVIARVHHKQSDFGGYLDLMLDFIVYLAIPVAFVVATPVPIVTWGAIALLSAYVINLLSWSALSSLLEKRRNGTSDRLTSLEMPTGLIEGAETILVYSLFFLLPEYVGLLFFVFAGLVLFTAGQRVVWAAKNL